MASAQESPLDKSFEALLQGVDSSSETENPIEMEDQHSLSMVEKHAGQDSSYSVKTSAYSLASSMSRHSEIYDPVREPSLQSCASQRSQHSQPRTPKIHVTDSVFSVASKKSTERMSVVSFESGGARSYRVSEAGEINFLQKNYFADRKLREGTITVRKALLLTFIILSLVLCALIIMIMWMNSASANAESRDVCDEATTGLIRNLHQQILNGTFDLIAFYMNPPFLVNSIVQNAVTRGDVGKNDWGRNIEFYWDIKRTFYLNDVRRMSITLTDTQTISFIALDYFGTGGLGQFLWIRQNNTICTFCKTPDNLSYDPSLLYRYTFPDAVSTESFNLSSADYMDNLYVPLEQRGWFLTTYNQPQQPDGHGKLVWTDVWSKVSQGTGIRLSVMLGHCIRAGGVPCKFIVGADLLLNGIVDYVSSIRPTENTRIVVMEQNGLLIAGSGVEVAGYDAEGVVERYNYTKVNDSIIEKIGNILIEHFGSLDAVSGAGTLDSTDGITTSYVLYNDPYGLKWVIAVGVYDDDFLGESREKHEQLTQKQTETSFVLLGYSVLILIVGVVIFQLITFQITSPLKRLNRELAAVAEFKFDENTTAVESTEVTWNTRLRELASIGNSFDIMRHNMQCFSRYIPPSVVDMIVQGHLNAALGVEPKQVTVFFSDLLNFTTIAESLPPRVLIEVLGTYLDQMSRIIMENEGTVGEFVGDGILAFWNSPYDVVEHQARACDASLIMQQVLAEARAIQEEELATAGEAGRKPQLRARMGITAGRVLHGNLGTPDRMKFGVVGDAVNTASRLESLCGFYGVGILVSQQIEKEIRGLYIVRHVDRVVVKGKKRTTELYELICKKGEATAQLQRYADQYHSFMHLYWNRRFSDALELIRQYQQEFSFDVASGLIKRRCEYYQLHPPEKSWNGVYTHLDKEGGGALDE